MNEQAHIDFFGRPIKAGDFFTFYFKDGERATCSVGQVVSLHQGGVRARTVRGQFGDWETNVTNIRAMNRMVIVTKDSLPEAIQKAIASAKPAKY